MLGELAEDVAVDLRAGLRGIDGERDRRAAAIRLRGRADSEAREHDREHAGGAPGETQGQHHSGAPGERALQPCWRSATPLFI